MLHATVGAKWRLLQKCSLFLGSFTSAATELPATIPLSKLKMQSCKRFEEACREHLEAVFQKIKKELNPIAELFSGLMWCVVFSYERSYTYRFSVAIRAGAIQWVGWVWQKGLHAWQNVILWCSCDIKSNCYETHLIRSELHICSALIRLAPTDKF